MMSVIGLFGWDLLAGVDNILKNPDFVMIQHAASAALVLRKFLQSTYPSSLQVNEVHQIEIIKSESLQCYFLAIKEMKWNNNINNSTYIMCYYLEYTCMKVWYIT